MEARTWLDAPFIEVDPAAGHGIDHRGEGRGSRPPAPRRGSALGPARPKARPGRGPEGPGRGAVAAKDAAPETPAEPAMTAVADRIWAKVAIPRGQSLDPSKDKRRKKPKNKVRDPSPAVAAADDRARTGGRDAGRRSRRTPRPMSARPGSAATWRCIRTNRPTPTKKDQAKPKGDDINGEAVYLDNKGKGKINAKVFHRDPTDPTPLPGPIRWAKVSTDDMIIFGADALDGPGARQGLGERPGHLDSSGPTAP